MQDCLGGAGLARHQGSVERCHFDVKGIITRMVDAKRSECTTEAEKRMFTWTNEIPSAIRAMNSTCSRGTGNVEPYEIVFGGMKFHEPLLESFRLIPDFQ